MVADEKVLSSWNVEGTAETQHTASILPVTWSTTGPECMKQATANHSVTDHLAQKNQKSHISESPFKDTREPAQKGGQRPWREESVETPLGVTIPLRNAPTLRGQRWEQEAGEPGQRSDSWHALECVPTEKESPWKRPRLWAGTQKAAL